MRPQQSRVVYLLGSLAFLTGLAGCPSTPKEAPIADRSDWRIEGARMVGCCCATPCPCRLNHKPMHEHGCDSTTVIHIDRGHIRGVNVDGVTMMYAVGGTSTD